MSWADAFNTLSDYVVKIETPAGAGTGFFFAYNEDKSVVGIATALHVVEDAQEWRQPVKIIHVSSKKELFLTENDRVILVDYKRDSAAILLFTKKVTDAGLPMPKDMLSMMPRDKIKRIGVPLAWTGYPAIASRTLCLFQGSVSAFNKANDSYYIDGIAINGVSGGPVFSDENGVPQIVGIVSAYQYNRQSGGNLPGLLMVQDATHLNDIVESIKSLDEARKKGTQAAAEQKEQAPAAAPGPAEPGRAAEKGNLPTPAAEPPAAPKRRGLRRREPGPAA